MAFPDAWMNELLYKNDIVSVISPYVELKPKGRRLWGCCPLHGEKTPSFSVTPDKQLFYCFGCHKGGSVIQFIMEMERLSFPEAVRFLAEKSGMQLPEETNDIETQKQRAYRDRLYDALNLAARYYMETLLSPTGRAGQAYLLNRGISSEAVKRFGLGFAPEGWDNLKRELTGKGFTEQELVDAGLLVRNAQRGSVYDAYRNRVIYPIVGTNKRVLGFGARVLTDEKPKYINTGDTPVYNKRNNLYGLNLMRGQKLSELIIVEGYMDVIGLYMAGIQNAVASLGTALTQQQAGLMKRFAERIYIAYDGDAAGQNAMIRGLDIVKAEGLDVRVIVFPDGLDPDELVRQRGREAFDQCKRDALSLNAFKLLSMKRQYAMDDADAREAFAKKACQFIGTLEPVERTRQIEWLAKQTGYPEEALLKQAELTGPQLTKSVLPTGSARRFTRSRMDEPTESLRTRTENEILNAMFLSRQAAETAIQKNVLELFSEDIFRDFALAIVTAYACGETPNAAKILSELPPEAAGRFSAILKQDATCDEPVGYMESCVKQLERCNLKQEMDEIRERMSDTGLDEDEKRRLSQRFVECKRCLDR